jgi:hypothetical protein
VFLQQFIFLFGTSSIYYVERVETQAKKKIELLKEHCTLIEKFKMDKHNSQLEYDEWAKKVGQESAAGR